MKTQIIKFFFIVLILIIIFQIIINPIFCIVKIQITPYSLKSGQYRPNDSVVSLNNQEISQDKWYRLWGGISEDTGTDIATDYNYNILIGGYTYSFGDIGQGFIAKYDIMGNLTWSRLWGGPSEDIGNGIAVDHDNNIYLVGYTVIFGHGLDVFIVKFDAEGNELWNRTWGGSEIDTCYDIDVDSTNHLYLVGYTTSFGFGGDTFIIKYDTDGNQLWNQTWGGSKKEVAYGLIIDNYNDIYVTGSTNSFGESDLDAFLLKYNSSAYLIWNETWGGLNDDESFSITCDINNNIYITGSTKSYSINNNSDLMIVKYNTSGHQIWNQIWGGNNDDYGQGIFFKNNKCYITGGTKSFGAGNSDVFLVIYDDYGNQLSNWTWGGGNCESGSKITVDNENNTYIVGSTNSLGNGSFDIILIKNYPEFPVPIIPGMVLEFTLISLMIFLVWSVSCLKFKKFSYNLFFSNFIEKRDE